MHELDGLVRGIRSQDPAHDRLLIERAYKFAVSAHEGQTRKSGEPYVTHPLSVAGIIADLGLDAASVCAGLLHDCVEDTSATVEQLMTDFGKEVAFLVDGVTKLGKLPYSTREEQQAENFRKMLLAMARDIRVILVKLCDRLDNMRSLAHLATDKQERIAAETMQIYAPLANRLGLSRIKMELEDLSFRYLHPAEYEALATELMQTQAERDAYIAQVEGMVEREMSAGGVPCTVTGRAKHMWSLHSKMRRLGRTLSEINDVIGFRVLTDTPMHCYQALGVAHQKWTPIPGRFKDFIALPKPNLYQSLHTAVIGPGGERFEIQIRTHEMNQIADQGIAAHWRYKESGLPSTDEKKFAWLRGLMETQKELRDPTEFLETVKVDLFADEVFVFTPQGEVRSLPQGACPIDYAYEIHTNIGDRCSGARINGMIVPLRYQLRNGDTVEIITSPNQRPNKDWLGLVKTGKARTKIRYWLRKEQRDRAVELGADLLEKAFRRAGSSFKSSEKALVAKLGDFKCETVDDLLTQVGYGHVTPQQVLAAVGTSARGESSPTSPPNILRNLLRKVTRKTSTSGIKVAGQDDILVRFATCCSPLPGDVVIGFISRGRGVSVHRRDCAKALDLDPDRRIDVEWDGTGTSLHEVAIQVVCADKPGLLAHISQCFTDQKMNISQAHCRALDNGRAVNTFHTTVKNTEQLKTVMRALTRIKGVTAVERVASEPTN